MADANVDPKSSSKSYAEAVSPMDQSSNDQSVIISEVKLIFILEQDLFGSSKYKAVVLHRGQVDTRTNITCNKCLQEGHKSYECPNDWVCRTCWWTAVIKQAIALLAQMIGYVRHVGNLVTQQNTAMQTLILLVKVANLNQNQIQTFPHIQKAVESMCSKQPKQLMQEHKTPNLTFNRQASNNLDDHSNLCEKKANRQVKKAKRAKNKKDKQNTNKDQPSMERFLAEAFRTPSNKTNKEKKTRTKQTASTPTDELHKREEPVKKTKS
ncbi:Hypothetical predicted protein [Mytilus galloprovincialis]|uniref:CCHC-type domain-containing protein n=1 Tax=Mytilus galloprovincialis TaxID=29158 RepID=A0A8B6G0Z0_MYTGA|nr:Hypothetical predicted protein [Mytilus galloprovincialis]